MSRVRCGPVPFVVILTGASATAFACSSSPSSSSVAEPEAGLRAPAWPAARESDGARDAAEAPTVVPTAAPVALDASPEASEASIDSGGKNGLACTRVDALAAGRQSCVVKVGSVELKIVAGTGTAATKALPFRVGLYVHGDGAASHIDNSVLEAMLPWADTVHGLAVSALAPNGCAWWLAPSYDCNGVAGAGDLDGAHANAAALANALDAIASAYDIRADGLRYYSASGGSIFLTTEWIPLHGATHPGVFALMCGGSVSYVPYAWDTRDASLRARIPTWFTYGSLDELRPQIEATAADYVAKGFVVTTKMIPNQGHCTFDAHAEAMGIWSANP